MVNTNVWFFVNCMERTTPSIFVKICFLTMNIVHNQIAYSCKYGRKKINYADSNKTSNIDFTFLV